MSFNSDTYSWTRGCTYSVPRPKPLYYSCPAAKASGGTHTNCFCKTSSPSNCVSLYLNGQNDSCSCGAEHEDGPDHLGGGEVPAALEDVPDAVQGARHAVLQHGLHNCILLKFSQCHFCSLFEKSLVFKLPHKTSLASSQPYLWLTYSSSEPDPIRRCKV